jgi:hypothetical protein
MVGLAKWNQRTGLREDEIPAYAVSTDLRAESNTLSFWRCASQPDAPDWRASLDEVALAIACGRDRVHKLDLVWLPLREIESGGLSVADSQGRTPIEDLRGTHLDVVSLDVRRFCAIAEMIGAAVQQKRYARRTAGEVRKLLVRAVAERRVRLDTLAEEIQAGLRAALGSA